MSAPALTHLLYLHGFRSSPQSTKARRIGAWMARHRPEVHWACPQLPPSPREALAAIDALTAAWPTATMAVIGSSLGGFYAAVLAQRRGCRAVLLNPAADPARDLAGHIGQTTAWHSAERFFFHPGFIDELRAMTPREFTRAPAWLAVIAQGDEVLDWREMCARYGAAQVKLLPGSDHALSDFDAHWPDVAAFLALGGAPLAA